MDQPTRHQIRLILEETGDRFKQAVDDFHHPYISPAVDSQVRSVIVALEAMEEEASKLITTNVDRVSAVAKDVEAFAMMEENLGVSLTFLSHKLNSVLHLAFAFSRPDETRDPIRKDVLSRFSESRDRLVQQLELHRFMFVIRNPAVTDVAEETPSVDPAKPKGGRPLAAHWDAMWAAIAVALYTTDLEPETQADIERAMKDWLASNGIDAGDASVRTRAQQLWRKLKEYEESKALRRSAKGP